jgi:hypothetical protein
VAERCAGCAPATLPAGRAGHGYPTIAVGRDDGDVSPTSGTFEADYPGRLSSSKRVGVTAVEFGLSRG